MQQKYKHKHNKAYAVYMSMYSNAIFFCLPVRASASLLSAFAVVKPNNNNMRTQLQNSRYKNRGRNKTRQTFVHICAFVLFRLAVALGFLAAANRLAIGGRRHQHE